MFIFLCSPQNYIRHGWIVLTSSIRNTINSTSAGIAPFPSLQPSYI
uniref:Uncharacterized protein n=1 Tax=Arundo donax TaxID=35708 RepID=A0A0A9EUC0_ARUDO